MQIPKLLAASVMLLAGANACASMLQPAPASQPISRAKSCDDCIDFRVSAYRFKTPINASVASIFNMLGQRGITPEQAGTPVFLHAKPEALADALSLHGQLTPVLQWSGTTLPGQPLPLQISSEREGKEKGFEGLFNWSAFSPVTPTWAPLLNFSLKVVDGSSMVSNSGRWLFPRGATLLNVQPFEGDAIVWIIQVK
ncbi:hypothetical protein J1782_07270 [Rahnella sp. BCC 1045]|uniref:hypothetical protein n=1 Tax=Rahnella sp. BCC 1045 TaxID=2816251 RepID=UPI001C262468|nr:hypothetical protein [Rahnella sp. BCC 1045]MBU9819686.1 hypothetical protein [Rahnella sp. BCC 1045]